MSTRATESSPVKPVDHDLRNGRAIRVVQERRPCPGLAIEIDSRRGVKPSRTQIDAIFVRQPHQLGEPEPRDPAGARSKAHAFSNPISAGCSPVGASPGARWRAAVSESRCFNISQARRAAVPFKSVEAEAAVGEVLWFFSVDVGMTRTASKRQRKTVGDDLTDLGEQPLPHLCPTRRNLDRAVSIDVDQGAGLVQMCAA